MKRMSLAVLTAFISLLASAQVPEGYRIVDSLVFTRVSAVDTTLYGRNIFAVLPDGVTVMQTEAVRAAVAGRIAENDLSEFNGFRIRIFSDNSQNARNASSSVLYRFKMRFPQMSAYRTFDNPNFKVTVGDFRTRSEALSALKAIQPEFPSAFIVREKFKYPAFSGGSDFKVDTLKILRRM